MLAAFYCLLTYLKKQKSMKILYTGITLLAMGMYTYFSHAIIIPLLLGVSVFIFRKSFPILTRKLFFVFSFWMLLIIPLFLIVLTNPGSRYRSQTVFITQDINLGKQMDYTNKYKAILDFSFNRYLDQFNPIFIFGNGLELTNQGPLGVGPLLFIELPFLILGMIYLIKMGGFNQEKKFILAWILIGMVPSGLTFEPHSPHRSIMVFTMLNVISAAGLYLFIKKFKSFKIIAILTIIFALNYVYFLHMYFVNFPFEKSESIHYPFKQVAQFVWSQHDSVDQIIFDPLYGESAPVIGTAAHYYLAYFGGYPPAKFQKEYHLGDKEREVIFDKFSIRKIEWRDDQQLKNVLVIGSSWSLPIQSINKDKVIKTFYFYDGKPAFYTIKL